MQQESVAKQEAERQQRIQKNQEERAQFKDVDMSKYEEESRNKRDAMMKT